jgi:hypothetical protein
MESALNTFDGIADILCILDDHYKDGNITLACVQDFLGMEAIESRLPDAMRCLAPEKFHEDIQPFLHKHKI